MADFRARFKARVRVALLVAAGGWIVPSLLLASDPTANIGKIFRNRVVAIFFFGPNFAAI